jgi:hypothetical protein
MIGRAHVAVSLELLEQVLHMPSTTHIVGAAYNEHALLLVVESPDLPEDTLTVRVPVVRRVEWEWGEAIENVIS